MAEQLVETPGEVLLEWRDGGGTLQVADPFMEPKYNFIRLQPVYT